MNTLAYTRQLRLTVEINQAVEAAVASDPDMTLEDVLTSLDAAKADALMVVHRTRNHPRPARNPR